MSEQDPLEGLAEVHVSDIGTFRTCRWRWDWSSNLRQNLERAVPVPHFLLGRAVHYALSQYYEGFDPLEAYERFIEKDLSLSDHLKLVSDMELKTKILDSVVLGRGMVGHYISWAPRHDKDWEVLSTEKIEQLVRRELGFYYEGRFDGIWRYKPDGTLWLKEFKTTRSMTETDFIYRDPQPTLYQVMAENAVGQPISGVLYTFLWKKVPDFPKRLKNGEFSKAQDQNTTASLYMEALRNDARAMATDSVTGEINQADYDRMLQHFMLDYAEILTTLAEEESKYFHRIKLEKTRTEITLGMEHIGQTVLEMLDPETPMYPAPSQIKCPRCPFNEPCRVRHMGGDYSQLIHDDYRPRSKWEIALLEEFEGG